MTIQLDQRYVVASMDGYLCELDVECSTIRINTGFIITLSQ